MESETVRGDDAEHFYPDQSGEQNCKGGPHKNCEWYFTKFQYIFHSSTLKYIPVPLATLICILYLSHHQQAKPFLIEIHYYYYYYYYYDQIYFLWRSTGLISKSMKMLQIQNGFFQGAPDSLHLSLLSLFMNIVFS